MKQNSFVHRALICTTICLLALACGMQAGAKGVYQEPDAFISEAFGGNVPEASRILLKGEVKKQIEKILGHRYKSIKIPYWQDSGRTVWILDEIGKDLPITTGFIIATSGRIERVKVLIFRETRGWEVRHDFFTDQFLDLTTTSDYKKLSGHIDNVTGATLSVNAIKKLSKMALYLHNQVSKQ